MIEPKETLYRTFQHPLSDVDLHTHFTIDASDLAFAQQQVRRKGPLRTQLLILLKCAQYLHYLPSAKDIPYAVMQHIAYSVDNNSTVTKKGFTQEYATSRTYSRHAKAIRKHLRWNCDSSQAKQHCLSIGSLIAEKRERLVDIFNALTESLMTHQFELPAFTTLEKIAYNVRARANEQWYHDIGETVSPSDEKKLLKLHDELKKDEHYSDWHKIKQNPSAPTYKKILEFIDHLKWLAELAQLTPQLNHIPLIKRHKFRDEALSLHSSDMRKVKAKKRLALTVVLIRSQYSKALDSACELIIKTMHEVVAKATQDYLQACHVNRRNTDDLVELLRDLINAYQKEGAEADRWQIFTELFPSNADDLLAACNEHLALSESNNRPFMMNWYSKRRSLLLDLLGCIEFDSHRQDQAFLSLSEYIVQNRHKRSKTASILKDQIDLKWLTDRAMKKLVIVQFKSDKI